MSPIQVSPVDKNTMHGRRFQKNSQTLAYGVPGFQTPVLETLYIIEKIFRALRAHSKTLPASYDTFKTSVFVPIVFLLIHSFGVFKVWFFYVYSFLF